MNFYKHFLGDYARDTAHLSMLEHGAYRLMLDHYYATGKSLPNDNAALYRICGAVSKPERDAVTRVAEAFFPVNGDGTRHNNRADKEIAEAVAYAEAQSERANKRWGNRTDKQLDMPADMPPHMPAHQSGICPEDASHSHSQKKIKPLSGFEEFYQAYPRKVGKGAAEKTWAKMRPSPELLAEMLSALRVWDVPTDPKFIPHPSTWLNDKRWLDEPPVVQRRVAI